MLSRYTGALHHCIRLDYCNSGISCAWVQMMGEHKGVLSIGESSGEENSTATSLSLNKDCV